MRSTTLSYGDLGRYASSLLCSMLVNALTVANIDYRPTTAQALSCIA